MGRLALVSLLIRGRSVEYYGVIGPVRVHLWDSWPHEVAPDLASAKSVRPDRSSRAGTPCEEWSIHLTVYYMHKSCATSGRDSLSVGVPVIEHTPKARLGEPSS